jgi:hypothetical protein
MRVYRSLLATDGPTRANKPNGYLLGSYRIATTPELSSSRPTSLNPLKIRVLFGISAPTGE